MLGKLRVNIKELALSHKLNEIFSLASRSLFAHKITSSETLFGETKSVGEFWRTFISKLM
jgi:hypothetical protein